MGEALPVGTVTFLLADVEGSTRLWESEPAAMTSMLAGLERILDQTIPWHGGARPVEQGEDDSFVVAFSRASDAVACALDLQRAPLGPIRLRIGLHSGEAQLRDDDNYVGPEVNRAARLRDLAHGGQTVLSGTTSDMVVDRLPEGAWLENLGSHRLRDLTRPEPVAQLCHPDVRMEFPALRSLNVFEHNLPVQLTSFIGRAAEMIQIVQLLRDNRLVTLTGAGGAGKTRLALQVAAEMMAEFPAGVWQVDLGPLTDPAVVAIGLVRALGLADEPGHSSMETAVGYLAGRRALVILDNCEHLLDACALIIDELRRACPTLTILATSREPIGVEGEATWRVPSMSLTTDAAELFVDRAQLARPGFVLADHAEAVAEICRRLDGIPLAIELAAARLRAFSPAEISAGLQDRFRLLTGGARTAVRRQQTLRASVDWSHALLTEPERVLFRRLAAFAGGFDLEAARAVAGGDGLEAHQVLDQLALLVDKSLVAAEESRMNTRYRLLETVRQYAQEKLAESGDAQAVRARHRDHYLRLARLVDAPLSAQHRRYLERAEIDIDNLRAAFQWSREVADVEMALRLASSLEELWIGRSWYIEGLSWLDAALDDESTHPGPAAPAARSKALADAALLDAWTGVPRRRLGQAEEAVALARQVDDAGLLARALTAAGLEAGYLADAGRDSFAEAIGLARQAGDTWIQAQILDYQAFAEFISGDPVASRAFAEEGCAVAEQTGNDYFSRGCRVWLGAALVMQGDLFAGRAMLEDVMTEADAAREPQWKMWARALLGQARAALGDPDEAGRLGEASLAVAREMGVDALEAVGHYTLSVVAMAAGDPAALRQASLAFWQRVEHFLPEYDAYWLTYVAEADLAAGDLPSALRHAEESVTSSLRSNLMYPGMQAHLTRARVAVALGDIDGANHHAHQGLLVARRLDAKIGAIEAFECLAGISGDADNRLQAARLAGAADALRRQIGAVRFAIHQARYDTHIRALRTSMGEAEFDKAWAEGAVLSTEAAVAYAMRGRGQRTRPTVGWASLTPTESEVARLVGEGLPNKDIASRLFISPRTVQSHLTHIYTKLAFTSRVQLAQEASRHR